MHPLVWEARSKGVVVVCRIAALATVGLLAAGCGSHAPKLVVGVVEDAAKSADPHAELARTRESGFRAVALSSIWTRGSRAPAPAELESLRAASAAAAAEKIRPIVTVYQFSSQTPASPSDDSDFAAYAAAKA